jgi:uncharacterized FlgJ-related protein
MVTVILEHVKVTELPADWVKRIKAKASDTVRITIAKEPSASKSVKAKKPNNTFGMWADREDIGDVGEYVRKLRQPRYSINK